MKLNLKPSGDRGFATLVVMMVVALMLVYVAGNVTSLGYVDRSLRLIEERQLRKFPKPPEAKEVRP